MSRVVSHKSQQSGVSSVPTSMSPNGWHPATASTPKHGGTKSTLLGGSSTFGCRLLRQLRRAARGTKLSAPDMLLMGDFGRDLDKEKALCIAAALQRIGLVGQLSVVANVGDAKMRARLAKGTLSALSVSQCSVSAGSCAGAPELRSLPFEYEHCDYLAPEGDVRVGSGHELVFFALEAARKVGRKVCVVLTSALSDMAAVMEDPRWEEMRDVVASITVSGGMTLSGRKLYMDPAAGNNSFDLAAAEKVYKKLQADNRIPFVVVTRHAAHECQLPRNAFSGSMHPVAQRLKLVAEPALQSLWERVNANSAERAACRIPARCDNRWFRKAFLRDDTPKDLGPSDRVWDHVADLNESWNDGLATLAGVVLSLENRLPSHEMFSLYSEGGTNTHVLGLDETLTGVSDPVGVSELLRELMVMVVGGGDGTLLRRAAELAQGQRPVDLVLMGDYGKDLDDETALLVVASFKRIGLIGDVSVVANLGDSKMRARLAKGTLQALQLGECPVAAGSHGGRPDEELYEHEFAHCDYLAEERELEQMGGHELVFAAIQRAASRRRKAVVVLGSAMTDMAAVLRDPRWPEARASVLCVAAMGGVKESEGGALSIDLTAANNAFDAAAAEEAYAALQNASKPQFIVCTRFAAGVCQMPRGALDGASHPVSKRLVGVQLPGLQKLWERSHRTQEERLLAKDALPARCDAAWFRSTFLVDCAPDSLGSHDPIWEYVKGFNEYDALALVAGVAAAHPPMLDEFFNCHRCPKTNCTAIGLTAQHHGIAKPTRMGELLHDCVVLAFEGRSKKGRMVETLEEDGTWKKWLVLRAVREEGPDAWFAWDMSKTSSGPMVNIYMPPALEGQMWRYPATRLPGDDELVLTDPVTTCMYREISGVQFFHALSHTGWKALREGFQTREGDVLLVGPVGTGRTSVQVVCQALRGSKKLDKVDMSLPGCLDMAMARGKYDVTDLNQSIAKIFGDIRVFKTFFPPAFLPCKTSRDSLPSGLKVIYVVRDPRDVCLSQYSCAKNMCFADAERATWGRWLDMYCTGEQMAGLTGPWLSFSLEWWRMHQQHPDQVLWLVFEDMLREPRETIRQVASFLDVPVEDDTVAHLAGIFDFSELMRRFGQELKGACLREGVVGSHRRVFSAEDYKRFRAEVIQPALVAGMRLAPEVLRDGSNGQGA